MCINIYRQICAYPQSSCTSILARTGLSVTSCQISLGDSIALICSALHSHIGRNTRAHLRAHSSIRFDCNARFVIVLWDSFLSWISEMIVIIIHVGHHPRYYQLDIRAGHFSSSPVHLAWQRCIFVRVCCRGLLSLAQQCLVRLCYCCDYSVAAMTSLPPTPPTSSTSPASRASPNPHLPTSSSTSNTLLPLLEVRTTITTA